MSSAGSSFLPTIRSLRCFVVTAQRCVLSLRFVSLAVKITLFGHPDSLKTLTHDRKQDTLAQDRATLMRESV